MPTLALRAIIAAALLLSFGGILRAETKPVPAVAEDERLLPYVKPGQLVDIGGRHINLRCSGSGGPTVILMAGSSSWSPVWYVTQPEIAKRACVCAFDRASYGFSDPAPQPQILPDTVSDLHAALKAANVPAPYVLVGHSLGGLEARLFAQRWPQEVAGMVLVDTSPAAEFLIEVNQPGYDEGDGMEAYTSEKLKCVLLAAHGPLDPSNPEYKHCSIGPLPDGTPEALRKMWPSFFTADHAAAQVSLISSLFTHRYDSADHLLFGDKPLVVLSADVGFGLSGPVGSFWRNYRKLWFAQHEALAHMSSRGVHRVIEHSGHEIQLDKPQAVVEAVDEVLRQLPGATS
jgi:pimeloyl-ACP methyl ester carboxylesterase